MLAKATLHNHGEITLPADIQEKAHLQDGDAVEVELTSEGILLRPIRTDPTQAWFWAESWQEGEKAASDDLASGRVQCYSSSEDFMDELKKRSANNADL